MLPQEPVGLGKGGDPFDVERDVKPGIEAGLDRHRHEQA